MIDMKKQYQTRCGYPVRILCVDRKSKAFPVVGLVDMDGLETVTQWTREGNAGLSVEAGSFDLVEVEGEGRWKQ